jgi:hypothetical protein
LRWTVGFQSEKEMNRKAAEEMRTLFLSVGLFGALLANTASALTYVDNNPADVWLNPFHQSYTGQFNLLGYGYNPAVEHIDSAVVTFTLWDLPVFGFGESWKIKIEGDLFQTGGNFSGTLNVSDSLSASLLGNLNTDGILDYTVTARCGEFWLANANLTAETVARKIPRTPDSGATAALVGMGMLSLLGLKRRI